MLVGGGAADHELKRTVAWIRDLYEKGSRLTGRNAARSLGNEYDEHAKKEARTADVLRWWVAGLALVIAGAALWFNYAVTEKTLLLELARLSVTIPLGLLALYLAKESARHREVARWSRELAIALHTVDSYIVTSPKTHGHALRQALGMRIFGTAPDPVGQSDTHVLDELLGPVRKVTDSVQGLSEAAQNLRNAIEKPRGGRQA